MSLFLAVLATLFSVVNPLGAVPLYLALTKDYTKPERHKTVLNTSVYFFLILLLFFLAGSAILSFFGISLNALRIAGGMVIMMSGFGLLSGKFEQSRAISKSVKEEAMGKEDISFTPLAMPMLSGPGSISLLISLFSEHSELDQRAIVISVIGVTTVLVYLILRGAPYLFKLLGVAGLKAISRIMGFIVIAIGVQYIITGAVSLVKGLV